MNIHEATGFCQGYTAVEQRRPFVISWWGPWRKRLPFGKL